MTETRMSVEDRLVLRGERDPRLRSTVASIAVLAGRPDVPQLRYAVDAASRTVPRLRQRAVLPSVPTTEPRWVTDADFDLDHHLRRLALPEGATWEDFLALVEVLLATPFDPSRPQWLLTLVEGLEAGRTALVATMSPVMREAGRPLDLLGRFGDGVSRLDKVLPPEPVPTDLDPSDLARSGLAELPMRVLGLAMGSAREVLDAALGLGADPGRAIGAAVSALRGAGAVAAGGSAPDLTRASALVGRGARRRILTLDIPAGRLGGLASAGPLGGVHAAALGAALTAYHARVGLPDAVAPITAASHPFGVRAALDPSSHGTAHSLEPVSAFLPSAALDLLRGQVRVGDVAAVTLGERSALAAIAGSPIVAEYAVGPVPGNALTSVALLREGGLFVTVRFDPEAVRDEAGFVEALEAGWAQAVGSPAAPKKRAAAKRAAPVKRAAPAKRAGATRAATKRVTPPPAPTKPAATKPPATKPAATKPAAARRRSSS